MRHRPQPMSAAEYFAREDEAAAQACYDHASKFGITENPEDYMERHGFEGCEDSMPCVAGCPFIK